MRCKHYSGYERSLLWSTPQYDFMKGSDFISWGVIDLTGKDSV